MSDIIRIAHRYPTKCRFAMTAACVLMAGLFSRPVAAQYEPPRDAPREAPTGTAGAPLEEARRIAIGVSVAHDTNFFRDPAILREAQSETITTGYVGLRIDKPYAQQRFLLDATASAYRYDKNSYLNFEGFDYRAAWDWRLTPHVGGTLSANRTQAQTQFQDTFSRQSDVTITKNYSFSLDAWLFGGWHVLLGVSQSNQTSEQASLQGRPDYSETRGEAGIRYLFQAGSSLDALWRRIDGDQESQVINNVIVVSAENYQQDESELRATWIVSPKSSLTARVAYLDRRYDQIPANDFSGTAGELGYNWRPTDKLGLRIAATRNIEPWQSLSSNYRVSNTLSFAPAWSPTVKTSLYMNLRRTYDDYPASSTGLAERKDTTNFAVLGLNWLALRNLSIGASVNYERRSSNNPLVEYDATIGRISASLIF